MRSDMAKVVTEKERGGSSMPNRKSKLRVKAKDLDEDNDLPGPRRLPMSMGSSWNSKEFSDVLGPLRKWLHSQAKRRRPWSKVYSEIREVIPNRASQPVRHIWEAHIQAEIELHCRIGESGAVYALHRYHRGWEQVEGTFYVHPITGLFLWAPYKRRTKKPEPITMVQVDELTQLQKKKGIWYRCRFRHTGIPEAPLEQVSKRQLGKGELRAHGLRNEAL